MAWDVPSNHLTSSGREPCIHSPALLCGLSKPGQIQCPFLRLTIPVQQQWTCTHLTYSPSVKPTWEGPSLEHLLRCLFHRKTPNSVFKSSPHDMGTLPWCTTATRDWTTTAAPYTLPTDPTLWYLPLLISARLHCIMTTPSGQGPWLPQGLLFS